MHVLGKGAEFSQGYVSWCCCSTAHQRTKQQTGNISRQIGTEAMVAGLLMTSHTSSWEILAGRWCEQPEQPHRPYGFAMWMPNHPRWPCPGRNQIENQSGMNHMLRYPFNTDFKPHNKESMHALGLLLCPVLSVSFFCQDTDEAFVEYSVLGGLRRITYTFVTGKGINCWSTSGSKMRWTNPYIFLVSKPFNAFLIFLYAFLSFLLSQYVLLGFHL